MVFSSTIFLFVFLPVVLVLYYNPFFRGRTFRNNFLLLASLVFYAWGEPVFVFLMLFSIMITWLLGWKVQGKYAKIWLCVGISYHLTVLFVFKYLGFFAGQMGLLLKRDFSVVHITLPVGISFFTFQLMSYLFDIYYGRAYAQKNPVCVGLYIALFPQLIAGPIVRYEKIAVSITDRQETYDDVVTGMKRFVYGLGKKVLLSNYVSQIADYAFYPQNHRSVAMAWLGAVSYTLQIYFDFSGYSDMAIGLGRMFGFRFDENFNYPYIAKSVTEFWRRWHISLSTWFRDYVYLPLGGNHVKKSRWMFNLFLVWFLTGIWHGASWTFVVWGLFHFTFLIFEKTTGLAEKAGVFSHVYTMLAVVLAWVIFRSETLAAAVSYIAGMFGIGANGLAEPMFFEVLKGAAVVLIGCFIGCTPCMKNLFLWLKEKHHSWIESVWILAVFLLTVLQVVDASYHPFIYFNF